MIIGGAAVFNLVFCLHPSPLLQPGRGRGRGPVVVNAGPQLPPGYVLRAFDRVESTNDEARRLAEQGADAGVVVVADQQLKGRGRHGRIWQSPPGNLYASLLLRPDCSIAVSAQLSLVASLALAEALVALAPPDADVRVKWPNDVLVRGAKVAGLLLESAADAGERVAWVVVGSGVNIDSAPADTPYPATALALRRLSAARPARSAGALPGRPGPLARPLARRRLRRRASGLARARLRHR